ncbi:hypothetical protein C8R47DRAFT_917162, partial [Mycena vitilis]
LPPELECIIFEMAALSSLSNIPELMRVARRVKEWRVVEPILYSVLFLSSPFSLTKDLTPRHIEGFPLIPRDLLLQATGERQPSFLSAAVKHMYLDSFDNPAVTLPLKLSEVDTILGACARLSNLYVAWRGVESLQYVPILNRLGGLHRLTIDLESLFEFGPIDFAQPFLRNVRHLQLLDSWELSDHYTDLVLLPHLTHIAFNDTMP